MNQKCKSTIVIILLTTFFYSFNAKGQQIEYQIGETTKCVVDSNTIRIFLPSIIENEGLTFVINNDGKICSSGKNSHPNDFENMLDQLAEIKSKATISDKIYEQIKCSLVKDKKIKEYMMRNQSKIDENYIIKILNETDCI